MSNDNHPSHRNKQVFHVFLDTEFFIRHNFSFYKYELLQLLELTKEKKIVLYTTRITMKEVQCNINKKAEEAAQYFSKANQSNYKIIRNLENYEFLFNRNRLKEEITQKLLEEFRNFYNDSGMILIDISQVSIVKIIDKYFSEEPPFSNKEEKKHEFPDAIVIEALENWSISNQDKLYIISKDNDMVRSCTDSNNLISIKSLEKLIEQIAIADGNHESVTVFYEYFQDNFEYIEKNIIKHFYEFKYDRLINNGFEFDVDIKSIKINDKALINIDDKNNMLVFNVFLALDGETASSEIDASSYKQIDEYLWDINSIYYDDQVTLYFKVELKISYGEEKDLIDIQDIIFQSYDSTGYYDQEGNLCFEKELLYDVALRSHTPAKRQE